jgi:glucose uptake protein GlcU
MRRLRSTAREIRAALLHPIHFRPWQHLRHVSLAFGVALILLIWGAALSHIANERMAARRAVIEDAGA